MKRKKLFIIAIAAVAVAMCGVCVQAEKNASSSEMLWLNVEALSQDEGEPGSVSWSCWSQVTNSPGSKTWQCGSPCEKVMNAMGSGGEGVCYAKN